MHAKVLSTLVILLAVQELAGATPQPMVREPGDGQEPGAPSAGVIEFPDPAGDVVMDPANQPNAMDDYTAPVDLTSVRVHGETGEVFRITLTFRGLTIERQYPSTTSAGIDVAVCFSVDEVRYGVLLWYIYDADPIIVGNYKLLGVVDGDCSTQGVRFRDSVRDNGVVVDALGGIVEFVVRRGHLGALAGVEPPGIGATVTDVQAFARNHRNPSLRYDVAPDPGPSDKTLAFVYPLANRDLRLNPERTFYGAPPCDLNFDLRSFVVEWGGRRAVPVRLSNPGAARSVRFEVRTIDGLDWAPAILPGLRIAGGVPDAPAHVTLNVILDPPNAVKHKDCTTIVVRAVDAEDPLVVGEIALNIVAALPPAPDRNRFFLHADALAENPCSGHHIWMSLAEEEERDVRTPILLVPCDQANSRGAVDLTGTELSLSEVGAGFRQDLNPSRDIILNTTVTGRTGDVALRMRSDVLPTKAMVTAIVLVMGDGVYDILSEASAEVALTAEPSVVTMSLPIFFTREREPHGDPSRIVSAADLLYFGLRYEPGPPDSHLPGPVVAGKVYLLPEGSSFSLPIYESIKNNVVDPGRDGSVLGLKLESPPQVFANPGKARAFNFTLTNEGVATDVAQVDVVADHGDRWQIDVRPAEPIRLDPAQSQPVVVAVKPPDDVPESARLRLDVRVTSQADATAVATTTVWVVATRGDAQPDESVDSGPESEESESTPAPSVWASALALAVGVWAPARRRRRLRSPTPCTAG